MTLQEYKDAQVRVNELSAEQAKLEAQICKYKRENYKKMALECLAVMGTTEKIVDVVSCEIITNEDHLPSSHYSFEAKDTFCITKKKKEKELRIKFIVESI